MNTKQIYQNAVTPKSVKEAQEIQAEKKLEESSFASALEFQNYQQWLQQPQMQALLAHLESVELDLIKKARVAVNINDQVSVNKLILQADTISNITSYVRLKTPIY